MFEQVTDQHTVGFLRQTIKQKILDLGIWDEDFELWCRPGTTGPAFAMEDHKTMIEIFPQ